MPSVGNELSHVFDGATIRGGLAIVGAAGSTAYLNRDTAAHTARQQVMMRAQGYYAETVPRACLVNNTVAVTSRTYYCGVGLLAGDVVSTMSVAVTTLASGFSGTGIRFGLYSKDGALLASSADAQSVFGATGVKNISMTTPYTIVTDDIYYAAFNCVATTPPVMSRGHGSLLSPGANGVTYGIAGYENGTADLPSPGTPNFASGTNTLDYWIAIS